MIRPSTWLVHYRPPQQPGLRLICFPFAGGSASFFRSWQIELAPDIEICAVQLPGRETRFGEAAYTEVTAAVDALLPAIFGHLDVPTALFGHSLGAVLAYEITARLQSAGRPPRHLFVSAHRAPHLPESRPPLHQLPQEEFVQALRRFNGTPELVLQDPELMDLFLPILRADLQMDFDYFQPTCDALEVPITAFAGRQDRMSPVRGVQAWEQHTRAEFRMHLCDGEHFFLRESRQEVLAIIRSTLSRHLPAAGDRKE